jgi:tetratricopeptide (TPR) repeat protein
MRIGPVTSKALIRAGIGAAACLAVILASCRSTPPVPPTLTRLDELENLPPLIEYAFDLLPEIDDRDSRLFILTNAAASLVSRDDPVLADAILDVAADFVSGEYEGGRLIEALIELSRAYTDAGSIIRSVDLLETALDLSLDQDDSQRKGELVQEIIVACFSIGADALELLRRAVQQIYIIEDYELRANLLLDTARRYQETGESQRSQTLLQQAIPAAGSISPGLARARAYSLLGLRLEAAGEDRLSEIYSGKAVDELAGFSDSGPVAAIPSETRDRQLSEILINLARTGRASDALLYNALIGNPRLRLGALVETARGFYGAGAFLQADLVFERIFTALERDSAPDLVISILLGISQIYLDFDDPFSAQVYVNATESYFPLVEDPLQADSLLLEAALLYGRLEDYAAAEALSRRISDTYFTSLAFSGLAGIIIGDGEAGIASEDGLEGAAASRARIFLTEAAELPLESGYLADSIYGDIALLFMRLGRLEDALAEVSRIETAYPAALALVRIQTYVGLDDESSERVRATWNRVGR